MKMPEPFYTTSHICRFAQVSEGTVKKWYQKKLLKFHTLPQGLHRRVFEKDLLAFFKKYKMDHAITNLNNYIALNGE